MNRDEAARLLKERSALNSQPYGPDAIDAWAEALAPVSYGDAHKALHRAVKKANGDRVSVKAIFEELPPKEPTRTHTDPLGAKACPRCEGTGYSPSADEHGIVRYGPCPRCRPGAPMPGDEPRPPARDPWRGGPPVSGERMRQILSGIRDTHGWAPPKEPTRFAIMDPELVAARKAHWADVARRNAWANPGGHYPGCPCEACEQKRIRPNADVPADEPPPSTLHLVRDGLGAMAPPPPPILKAEADPSPEPATDEPF